MRTQQERIANQGRTYQTIEGYLVRVRRPKRNTHSLCQWNLEKSSWHRRSRSWKKYRKMQYKTKPHNEELSPCCVATLETHDDSKDCNGVLYGCNECHNKLTLVKGVWQLKIDKRRKKKVR